MKLCFSTLGCTDYSLEKILALAKKYDMDAVEIRGIGGELDNRRIASFSSDMIEKTKKAFALHGISPLVLGTSATFHNPDAYNNALDEGRAAIDLAVALGFSAIRVFGDRLTENKEAAIHAVRDGVYMLCEYAKGKGVSVLLEVHGDFVTEESLAPITLHCGKHPSFGLIWDVCHTRSSYPDFERFYDRFAPYIKHLHFKDISGNMHKLPGEGTLPLREIAKYVTEKGYDGYFSLEWERKWHPELPPIEEALDKYVSLLR